MDSNLVLSSLFTVHRKIKTVNRQPSTVNRRRRRPGFTVIEFLVGTGLVGIVSVMVASLYFAQFRLFSNQSTSIDVASQNKIAIDELTSQIREASAIVNSCCDGETTSANSLVLSLWPLDSNNEPYQPTPTSFDYIIYKQDAGDNTHLVKKTVPDPQSTRDAKTAVIATNLSATGLTFSYDNADPGLAAEVTVTITTSAISGTKTVTSTQTGKATLRNK